MHVVEGLYRELARALIWSDRVNFTMLVLLSFLLITAHNRLVISCSKSIRHRFKTRGWKTMSVFFCWSHELRNQTRAFTLKWMARNGTHVLEAKLTLTHPKIPSQVQDRDNAIPKVHYENNWKLNSVVTKIVHFNDNTLSIVRII